MTTKRMKFAMLAAVAAIGVGTGMAQATGDTGAQDKMFLKKAAQGGMAEIQASQMALKKSHNDDVKAYAQKMIDDHTKLMADMKPFMDKMMVPAPKLNPSQKTESERLASKRGDAFDKEYVTAMVGDHHHDLEEFKHESTTTANTDLKARVDSATQVIQQHTDMIDGIASKMNIPTPPAGQ